MINTGVISVNILAVLLLARRKSPFRGTISIMPPPLRRRFELLNRGRVDVGAAVEWRNRVWPQDCSRPGPAHQAERPLREVDMYEVFVDIPSCDLAEKLRSYDKHDVPIGEMCREIFRVESMCPGMPTADGGSTVTVVFSTFHWRKC